MLSPDASNSQMNPMRMQCEHLRFLFPLVVERVVPSHGQFPRSCVPGLFLYPLTDDRLKEGFALFLLEFVCIFGKFRHGCDRY